MSATNHSSSGPRRGRAKVDGRAAAPAERKLPERPRKLPAAARRSDAAAPAIAFADVEKVLGLTLNVARTRHARLTERQRQVANLMAHGKPNRQIAEELGISPKTLDIHRADVMHKLEAETVAQVANLANLLRLNDAAVAGSDGAGGA